ncbi:MAG: hypothetical protein MJ082_00440 [Clostridia bacterium]|nr:hypothetical protein [Clostridia bacterium]
MKNKKAEKKSYVPIFSLTEKEREEKIRKLEENRLSLTKEIESLLRDFAKASGEKSVGIRKTKVGRAPNDYGFEKK